MLPLKRDLVAAPDYQTVQPSPLLRSRSALFVGGMVFLATGSLIAKLLRAKRAQRSTMGKKIW